MIKPFAKAAFYIFFVNITMRTNDFFCKDYVFCMIKRFIYSIKQRFIRLTTYILVIGTSITPNIKENHNCKHLLESVITSIAFVELYLVDIRKHKKILQRVT